MGFLQEMHETFSIYTTFDPAKDSGTFSEKRRANDRYQQNHPAVHY